MNKIIKYYFIVMYIIYSFIGFTQVFNKICPGFLSFADLGLNWAVSIVLLLFPHYLFFCIWFALETLKKGLIK